MIDVQNVSLNYGGRNLLNNVSFQLQEKDRAILIGRNGAGKSTLFKIITGEIRQDDGRVNIPKGFAITALKQELPADAGRTVKEEAATVFKEKIDMEAELVVIEQRLHDDHSNDMDGLVRLLDRMEEIKHRLEFMGADQAEGETEKVLKGLGFKDTDFNRPTAEFSGGWRMRIELAKVLLSKPDAILLDEPNNHLDIESIQWLEQYLMQCNSIVMIISHDETFIELVGNRILEIENGKCIQFKGKLSQYREYREELVEKNESAYKNQQKIIQHKEKLIDKFRAKASKASFSKSLQKELARMDKVELLEGPNASMDLRFTASRPSGRIVVKTENLHLYYGDKKVLEGIDLIIERGQKIGVVGANGQGKTTLIKLIKGELKPTSGEVTLGHEVIMGYYAQDLSSTLTPSNTILQEIEDRAIPEMRTKVRNILGSLLFTGEEVDKKISVLSGGEKARVCLAALIVQPHNLLILDEPTHHLDMISKEILKEALAYYDGTVILVSHDRSFMDGIVEVVFEVKGGKHREYLGGIQEYLEKRQAEINESNNQDKSSGKDKSKLNNEDRKKQQRQQQYLERDIEKIEDKIKQIEAKMIDPSFFNSPTATQTMKELDDLKNQLEDKMQEWDEAIDN